MAINEENTEKICKNFRELSAGYGTRRASGRLKKEGQILLNQLYKNMKELELNINNQSVESLQSQAILTKYQEDIQNNQKKAFDHFTYDSQKV